MRHPTNLKAKGLIAGLTVVGLTLGVGAGAVIANVPALFAPAGLSAEEGIVTMPMPTPNYPRNENGLTYGSLLDSDSPDHEPDLIGVEATNGKSGFVRKSELDEASGANISNPEEAIRWSEGEGKLDHVIDVYQLDGTTVVGQFVITGSDSKG